ncbi:MAG: hypothetical protein RIG84_00445 [Roseovarius sp.]
MKAIAEYFRDLAADDRYFGAEPPTPDAEMLARIAEREIARRVDAHEESGKIVLRAAQALSQPEASPQPAPQPEATQPEPAIAQQPEEQPAPEIAEPDAADLAEIPADDAKIAAAAEEEPEIEFDAALFADDEAEEPEEAEMIAPAEAPEDEPDQVASRLRRIRSVVDQWNTSFETDDYSEDEHALDLLTKGEAGAEATLEELLAENAEADAVEEDVVEDETAEDDAVEDESFADEAAEADEETETDALIASQFDDAAEAEAETLGRTGEEAEDDFAEDLAENEPETVMADEEEDDELAALTARLAADDDEEDAPETQELAEEAPAQAATPRRQQDEDTLSQLLADAMPMDSEEDEADEAPFVLGGSERVVAAEDETAERPEPENEPEIAGHDGQGEHPLRARVVKMKRSEFEAAIASGQIEETLLEPLDEFGLDGDGLGDDTAVLSAEEEAELQNELAAVEAEMAMGAERTAGSVAAETGLDEAEDELDHAGPRGAERLKDAAGDPDVSRLFSEAANQFDAPDSSRRRNAIQHLRAAVAATKAEKKGVNALREETSEDPYRSDLAAVVRGNRPLEHAQHDDAPVERADEPRPSRVRREFDRDGTARTRRPSEERPAPLKLVAEQRIDTPREPVRPRRVSAAQMAVESEAVMTSSEGGFSAFAEQIGATGLSELLEAAAAYMADVEGRDQFSRPMLMGKLKELDHVDAESFSREDGLRSFGHLLRAGKLQKVKGGRFAVTDHTEFRAEARRAG